MMTKKAHQICIKRVYDEPSPDDGLRFLVDRLWPRGIRKDALRADWLKDVAPSQSLRKWFGHEPAKWPEFRRRYRSELEKNPGTWAPLLKALQKDTVTLLFSAREPDMNQAVVLKDFLTEKIPK